MYKEKIMEDKMIAKKTLLMVTIAILFIVSLNGAVLDNFTLMTEQYPPYNFEQDGQLQGIFVEILGEILKRDGSKQTAKDIKLYPWARGYKEVQSNVNSLLFGMTRSEEREKMFKWVGPLAPTKVVLLAKKSNKIVLKNKNELTNYLSGAIRDDIGHQLLTEAGVKDIDLSSDMLSCIKKLDSDRIKLWAYEENVGFWELKNQGKNTADYESVYVLLSSDLYIAFNKSASDDIIKRVQTLFEEIKKDGTYQKIVDKYLK
jgi:ABC-type amino acid transport substrate-binding protein